MTLRPLLGPLLACVALLGPAAAAAADTMRAVRIERFGGHDALVLQDIPRPTPGKGELLLRVHAAAVNPVDAHIRGGRVQGFIDVALPHVPGLDVSGVVAEVGTDVSGFPPGSEVFALLPLTRGGGYAEYVIVDAHQATAKPARLTHQQAAALPLVSLTAWQALIESGGLRRGQTVLIHGGSGGVGSVAIQIAKAHGARVVTTASAGNHDFVRSLGADVVIDYRSERFEDVASGVDLVLDTIGGDTQVRSFEVLKDGGTLVSLVGLGPAAGTPPRGIKATSILVGPNAEQLGRIAALVDSGALRPEVSLVLPLEKAADAHRQIETGHTRGKIVLEVAG